MRIKDCKLVDIRRITSESGSLAFIEESRDVPFEIKRVYFLYDVPAGAVRGSHAHKSLSQMFIAASGSFDVHPDREDAQRREPHEVPDRPVLFQNL